MKPSFLEGRNSTKAGGGGSVGDNYGLFGWKGEGGGVKGSRVV